MTAAPRFGFFFWPFSPEHTVRMASLGETLGWDLVGIADTPGNAMDRLRPRRAPSRGRRGGWRLRQLRLERAHVEQARGLLSEGARGAGRSEHDVDVWERYTTHRSQMDPGLTRRLGLFDYLRRRLAVAGTPDDCVAQVQAALQAGARNLMFTVSLASDPARTVELFGREVLPAVRQWHNVDRRES